MDIKLISNSGTYKQFLKVTLRFVSLKVIGTSPIPEALILLILPQEIDLKMVRCNLLSFVLYKVLSDTIYEKCPEPG